VATRPAAGGRSLSGLPIGWIVVNVAAGAVSGIFFTGADPAHVAANAKYGAVAGGLLLALSLFGAWMATGVAFWSAHWLVLHERFTLSRSWLAIGPLAGVGFMATQFLINIWGQWLLGPVAICVAAAAAGWIIGALQWMLMREPDVSANRWVAATSAGAALAALVWFPGFPWAMSHINTILGGAIAGGFYAVPGALVLVSRLFARRSVPGRPAVSRS
jgi:hypothetical protein